ncbi:tyrosine-type recombinase/integrase [Aquamicrobium zhengzhouense]|uniref:Site-specific integrase n=1 Tax=Aquamicrobium zhengzhouense TaxID=2781738 RepID=A0ABS0S8Q0_9HYPH|nr:site-specific integrase [Aquamicrobium zhengzhouense]MBI1619671.1 site-specific integrase [Aquamicrobium zhengzhouense]
MARRRGDRWQADVTINGKRVRRSFKTEDEAVEFEKFPLLGDFIMSRRLGSRARPQRTKYSVSLEYIAQRHFDAIWGENRDTKFIRGRLAVIFRMFGATTSVKLIDTRAVDYAIEQWLSEGLAPSTINNRLAVLSKLLKYAKRKGTIRDLPHIQRRRVNNQLERVWSESDERQAFEFLEQSGFIASREVLRFLLYTGARKGEAYLLKRSSVVDGWINFEGDTTKNGKSRQIPLVPQAREAWEKLCSMSDLEHPLAVVPINRLRYHWEQLREHFSAQRDRAFVPHMLRHTCATRLVAGGVPLPQVMKWMGHRSIQVTMRYVYVAPRDLEFAADVLSKRVTITR